MARLSPAMQSWWKNEVRPVNIQLIGLGQFNLVLFQYGKDVALMKSDIFGTDVRPYVWNAVTNLKHPRRGT